MPVEQGARPQVPRLHRRALEIARALTTPLVPDDYIEMINPLWSTRELKGRIEWIRRETPRSATVAIRPGFPWPGHEPGQYLRIGIELDGVRHWRAYTLTSDPGHPRGLISISVRLVEEGHVSPFFNRHAKPGTIVYLGEVEGRFSIPDPAPHKLLMISAGSGVTPIFSLLRGLHRRDALRDVVHIHSERIAEEIMFRRYFGALADSGCGYRRLEHLSGDNGRITPTDLDTLCPDWRERDTFLSGPPELLEAMTDHWKAEGLDERLRVEHFQPYAGMGKDGAAGEGGTVTFKLTGVKAECDGRTSMLEAGEEAGAKLAYGCRMGICHTCTCKLVSGRVRDMRSGDVYGQEGEMIRICISSPEGPVELEEGRVVAPGTDVRSKR